MNSPPKFEFKLISSFQDPLTRQLSEAVRIEQRGPDILNSRSEFNRCKVPRLRIETEAWNNKWLAKKVPSLEEESVEDNDWCDIQELDGECRKQGKKRKREEAEPRKKKRKFENLTGWDEVNEELSSHQEDLDGWFKVEKKKETSKPGNNILIEERIVKELKRNHPRGR